MATAQRVLSILDLYPGWSRLRDGVEIVHGPVRIESDAWSGTGAIILPGVTACEQAIVGAGAVVTRDMAP